MCDFGPNLSVAAYILEELRFGGVWLPEKQQTIKIESLKSFVFKQSMLFLS